MNFLRKSMARLERERKALGMTYLIVAERSGVSYYLVRRILQGKSPCKLKHVCRIAESLFMRLTVRFDNGPERTIVCR